MLCFLQQSSNILESCLSIEMNETFNGTFNFSYNELYQILLTHQQQTGNVTRNTEVILIGVYAFLMVAGLSANLIVSFVVARRPQMHTARNLYIVNLTVSDMTLCVVCMPFTLVSILRREWDLGLVLCKLVPTLQGTNIMVSIGTITVIALDRYFTIVRGQDSASNRRRVVTSIALVWFFSALAAMPVFIYQRTVPFTFHQVVLYEMCLEGWPSIEVKILYGTCVLLVQAIIPAAVVGIVHARIASYLNAHAKTQRDSRRAKRELQRNRRTTVLLSCVAILFAVSWLPLGIFSLIADVLVNNDNPLKISLQSLYVALAVCHITAMSSAVSNPVVYGWLNSNIRHEFLQLLPSKCARQAPHPLPEDGTGTTRTGVNMNHRRDSVTVLLQNGQKSMAAQPSSALTAL
uniref:G-protein coupled receptors family 1 profile domain-containing protein n=1 Tax=Clastoptera arizonana TaxID=38151 RepID=A0A1B6EEC8_9HEMI